MFDVRQIQSDFPILKQQIYGRPLVCLDNAATTHKPQTVPDGIIGFYSNSNSNIHRGTHYLSEQASDLYEKARRTVRDFIHAANETEIVFSRSSTESINVVAESFGRTFIKPGDEIIISEMEHHSNLVPWQMLCERGGAVLKIIPFDNSGQLQVDTLDTSLSAKTKLVALTYVSNVPGVVNPVKTVIAKAHAHAVPVLIDGAVKDSQSAVCRH